MRTDFANAWPCCIPARRGALRRIIHLAYRSFGGRLYPYGSRVSWEPSFVTHLSAEARATFQQF